MVPMEDPVAVETMQAARKVKATKMPPFMPTAFAIHTKPPDRPHSLIKALNIPTSNRITTTETDGRNALDGTFPEFVVAGAEDTADQKG